MQVKNTTIQNRTKHARLESEHRIPTQTVERSTVADFLYRLLDLNVSKESVIYSVGSHLVRGNNNPHLLKFLSEYDYPTVTIPDIPEDEFDLLGSIYQFLNSKKENLERGSFYTGGIIASDFVSDLVFDSNQLILDPACGSGSFLFRSNAPSSSIFGVDNDPIAIMIAKFNYFIKFPNADAPHLYCADFLKWAIQNQTLTFEYIIGNPPYGANMDLRNVFSYYVFSGESFSYFIEFAFRLLSTNGIFRFLLPESLLNVKRHADIRQFILEQTDLKRIKRFTSKFSGVMSDVFLLEIGHGQTPNYFFEDKKIEIIPKRIVKQFNHSVFVYLTQKDIAILNKVNSLKSETLAKSTFGLGVVTGDNRTKLFDHEIMNSEAILTGKEIQKYHCERPVNYIVFDRSNLQQVAPDYIYRAPEKLIYKTISKYLKVALDTNATLSTNSANIIIPKMETHDIYSVLGFLNSDLYSYLHLKLFGGVNKIAKENLMALPFPKLSSRQLTSISQLVRETLTVGDDLKLQEFVHKDIFNLTDEEIFYLRKSIEN